MSHESANPRRSPSPSPYAHSKDIVSLHKELEAKQHELTIAYQTSLELIETNNELHQQLEEQSVTIQRLEANVIDYEMKNMEYQQTINQTNDKYEERLGELAVTQQHLNNAMDEIKQYQETMQSLNHKIINNTNDSPLKSSQNGSGNKLDRNYNNIDYKNKLEKQQKKYDSLLRECEKYRNDHSLLIEQEIDLESLKKDIIKMEKRNKLLSDQIIELMDNNVELEKELNDNSIEIDEQNQTIEYLQTEHQHLMTKRLLTTSNINEFRSSLPNRSSHKLIDRFIDNKDLKRRLSVQLKNNFSDNSKLVMFANNIGDDDIMNGTDGTDGIGEEEQDLFTMVQNYENNEEYLRNTDFGAMHEDHGKDSVFSVESVTIQLPLLLCQFGILLLWFESYLLIFPIS